MHNFTACRLSCIFFTFTRIGKNQSPFYRSTISVSDHILVYVDGYFRGTLDPRFSHKKISDISWEGSLSSSNTPREELPLQATTFMTYRGTYDWRVSYQTDLFQRPAL